MLTCILKKPNYSCIKEFGFRAKTIFEEGFKKTIEWYIFNYAI